MNDRLNTRIKIPTEWYAGFNKSMDGLPRVVMTPNGTDKLSLGRINTVKRHSNGDRGIPAPAPPETVRGHNLSRELHSLYQ